MESFGHGLSIASAVVLRVDEILAVAAPGKEHPYTAVRCLGRVLTVDAARNHAIVVQPQSESFGEGGAAAEDGEAAASSLHGGEEDGADQANGLFVDTSLLERLDVPVGDLADIVGELCEAGDRVVLRARFASRVDGHFDLKLFDRALQAKRSFLAEMFAS